MKGTAKTKQKAEKKRLKLLKSYYKRYRNDDVLVDSNQVKYIVLGRYKIEKQYYFVVQDINGNIHLKKLVYSDNGVRVVGVARDGNQYYENKHIFDQWFSKAEIKRTKWLEKYYDQVAIGQLCRDRKYSLVLKRKYAGNYYFVLEDTKGNLIVFKLGWWYTRVKLEMLSKSEFEKNKLVFSEWIRKANIQNLITHMGG